MSATDFARRVMLDRSSWPRRQPESSLHPLETPTTEQPADRREETEEDTADLSETKHFGQKKVGWETICVPRIECNTLSTALESV